MIEESAHVREVDAGIATVSIQQRSACGSCAASGGCGTALLASWLPQRRLTFQLDNRIGAQKGDIVVVGLDERRLQYYALRLYATPLVGLIAGAVAGSWLADRVGIDPELMSVGLGLSGVLAALAWVRRRSQGLGRHDNTGVRLIRVARRDVGSPIPNATDLFSGVGTAVEQGHRK